MDGTHNMFVSPAAESVPNGPPWAVHVHIGGGDGDGGGRDGGECDGERDENAMSLAAGR